VPWKPLLMLELYCKLIYGDDLAVFFIIRSLLNYLVKNCEVGSAERFQNYNVFSEKQAKNFLFIFSTDSY
jgi:hypothetical protein